ncbi:MAG: ketoacyl-ACP synthase III [Austwickia sp.]|jgi:3-oxoacyl-[acyl-carrier-protein] synthase-3|nr:MAG: ketoacyl-ACP synthase III [Austwickia sp.]
MSVAPPAHVVPDSSRPPRPRLRTVRGPEFARILGVGDHRPERVIDNAELCRHIDSSDEWIRERSGIRQRRQAAPDSTVVDMGVAASRDALAHAGLTGSDVDAVICATITHPWQTPAAAPIIADRLGTTHAAAYDLSAACAGYCYAVACADDMIRAGRARHVLVIGVEKLSDYRALADRGTAFVFGDGAGAAVIGPSDTPGISATTSGSDGSGAGLIAQSTSWSDLQRRIAPQTLGLPGDDISRRAATSMGTPEAAAWPFIDMQGPSVFRWATATVTKICQEALAGAGIEPADLDAFIPHQANIRIVEAMAKKLKLPDHVVIADDIADMANTSAASVPLATAALLRSGRVKSGDLALQIGFGAGLAWAAQVVVLP